MLKSIRFCLFFREITKLVAVGHGRDFREVDSGLERLPVQIPLLTGQHRGALSRTLDPRCFIEEVHCSSTFG